MPAAPLFVTRPSPVPNLRPSPTSGMACVPLEAGCLKLACVPGSPVAYVKYIGPYFASQLRETCGGDTLQHVVDHFCGISSTLQLTQELERCSRNQRAGDRMQPPPEGQPAAPQAPETTYRRVPRCNRRVYASLIHLLLAAAARPDLFGQQVERLPQKSLQRLLVTVDAVMSSSSSKAS